MYHGQQGLSTVALPAVMAGYAEAGRRSMIEKAYIELRAIKLNAEAGRRSASFAVAYASRRGGGGKGHNRLLGPAYVALPTIQEL